jgi:HSP20 family protein
MAERQGAITPAREQRRMTRARPFGWSESPPNMLQRFADEMDRTFNEFGLGRRSGESSLWSQSGADTWAPSIDVVQRNNELTITADLPGLKRDEVSVEISDDAVTIQGERKREHEEEREGLYRSERSYGSFYRTIPLPDGAITEQANATFRDGVLKVTMPAPPASRGRRLEITEEGSAKR